MKIDRINPIDDGWWAFLTLSTNQASNLGNGDAVEFDTICKSGFSASVLDTITNVGRITLPAGKTFELTGGVHVYYDTAAFATSFEWVVISGTAISKSIRATGYSPGETTEIISQLKAKAIITTLVETTIELQKDDAAVITNYNATRTFATIKQIRDEDI